MKSKSKKKSAKKKYPFHKKIRLNLYVRIENMGPKNISDIIKDVSQMDATRYAIDFLNMEGLIKAKWVQQKKKSITLVIDLYLQENVSDKEIRSQIYYKSLEDGEYEGTDNGWVWRNQDYSAYATLNYKRDKSGVTVQDKSF